MSEKNWYHIKYIPKTQCNKIGCSQKKIVSKTGPWNTSGQVIQNNPPRTTNKAELYMIFKNPLKSRSQKENEELPNQNLGG